MKQIDKMIYANEVDCLRHYANGKYVVQIGAFKGYSACVMGPVATYLVSIDTFTTETVPHELKDSTLSDFVENTIHLDNSSVIVGNSHDKEVISRVPCYIEFLFIDGDHTYEGCLADLENFVPKVVSDGIIGVHDYSFKFTTVMAACMKFFRREPDETHGSLAIFKLDSEHETSTHYIRSDIYEKIKNINSNSQ